MKNDDLNDKNKVILVARELAFNAIPGPRVGDFYINEDTYSRFTHDWGDTIQGQYVGTNGSFYLGDGYASYSGGLSPAINKTDLELTDEVKEGVFWFFSENMAMAHNGINVWLKCRVFKIKGE